MNGKTSKIVIIILMLTQMLVANNTYVHAMDLSSYELAYEDNFNGSSLNTNDWFHRETEIYHGGYNRRENVSVSGGNLHIAFKKEDFNSDGIIDYTGGGVLSTHNFGYGYYETRAKLYGGGPGLHQSFWLMGLPYGLNQVPSYDQWVDDGLLPYYSQTIEIDGFETDSNNPNHVSLAYHKYQPTHNGFSAGSYSVDITNWFTMGFEYLPGQIKYYLNGNHVSTANIGNYYGQSPLWFTALANNWLSGPLGYVPAGAEATFDYFRYYNKSLPLVNRITNGSFDYVSSSMNKQYPVGWLEYGDIDTSTVVNTGGHTGSHALKHYNSTPYQVTTKQKIEHIPNATYRLTAWVKSSGGQSSAKMRVLNHGGTEITSDIIASNTWTQIMIDDIEVTSGEAIIAFTSIASGEQWLEVDDVVLKEKAANTPNEVTYECESMATATSTGYAVSYNDSNASNGVFNNYFSSGVNDYIEYTIPVEESGSYQVMVGDRLAYNKGIYQLEIDGVNQGSPIDLYSSTLGYRESNLLDVTFSTAGDKVFRFKVTGKNASSTYYQLAFDYIKLVKN